MRNQIKQLPPIATGLCLVLAGVLFPTAAFSQDRALEGFLKLAATDDVEQRVSGSISAPITEDIGFRLTGLWSDLDGYVDNLTYGDEINENKSKAVRGKLRC